MATPTDPDWFSRIISLAAFAVSFLTFIWTRLDKRRDRKSAERAGLPSVIMRWNSKIDGEGWYTLRLGFRDLNQNIKIDKVSVIKPRRSVIANWNGSVRSAAASTISPKWQFHAGPNPVHGADAVSAHLHLKTEGDVGHTVRLKIEGRFLEGAMKKFEIPLIAERE
jgi:hypothetical protein